MVLRYSNTQEVKESISEKIMAQVTYDEYSLFLI